jgi:hypothetical protein
MKETSMRRWTILGSVLAVLAIAVVIVVLWPSKDPLAGVQTVAVQGPDWGKTPQATTIQTPFLHGLEITLGQKHVTIVPTREQADAVLAVDEVKLGRIELVIQNGEFRGSASATCTLTNVRTGEKHRMAFYLTVRNGTVDARLVPIRFWQVWR